MYRRALLSGLALLFVLLTVGVMVAVTLMRQHALLVGAQYLSTRMVAYNEPEEMPLARLSRSERLRISIPHSRVLVVHVSVAAVNDSGLGSPPAHNLDHFLHWGQRHAVEEAEDTVLVLPRLTEADFRVGELCEDAAHANADNCRYLATHYPWDFQGRVLHLDSEQVSE